ncbi:MAG TPA: inner membrane CreD family protein, partial [Nevskiaceae bacterium]|nr:inner membrane CreD family protein [Nevskiaceae bacterium]
MSERLGTPMMRLLLIGLLLVLLQIPLGMIQGLIGERQARRNDAVDEVMGKWGQRQSVNGPLLRIPYIHHVDLGGTPPRRVAQTEYAYFLPARLDIQSRLHSQLRRRGLFEVPVYDAQLTLSGHFDAPDWTALHVAVEDIDLKDAELVLGISDVRAVHADVHLLWDGQELPFRPSGGADAEWKFSGVHAPLQDAAQTLARSDGVEFRITAGINGSVALDFAPMAEQTTAMVAADWPHPSFDGAWLPTQHQEQDGGFSARWSVSY